jgi:hypothetical protein
MVLADEISGDAAAATPSAQLPERKRRRVNMLNSCSCARGP